MSVRRFLGYFVALSACATLAFAPFLTGQTVDAPAPSEAAQRETAEIAVMQARAGYLYAAAAARRPAHKRLRVAFAD